MVCEVLVSALMTASMLGVRQVELYGTTLPFSWNGCSSPLWFGRELLDAAVGSDRLFGRSHRATVARLARFEKGGSCEAAISIPLNPLVGGQRARSWKISNGGGAIPPWKHLAENDRWAVIRYIRSVGGQ